MFLLEERVGRPEGQHLWREDIASLPPKEAQLRQALCWQAAERRCRLGYRPSGTEVSPDSRSPASPKTRCWLLWTWRNGSLRKEDQSRGRRCPGTVVTGVPPHVCQGGSDFGWYRVVEVFIADCSLRCVANRPAARSWNTVECTSEVASGRIQDLGLGCTDPKNLRNDALARQAVWLSWYFCPRGAGWTDSVANPLLCKYGGFRG